MSSNIELFKNVSSVSTLDEKQLVRIKERLPEFHRGKALIGHSTSQTSYSLQTMQMINDSPISRMKQCLAQINNRYLALQETYYKLERKKILIEKLRNKTDQYSKLSLEENQGHLETMVVSMNTSLKEIGMFQNMYDSIRKQNNIPENWNEKDYENQEIDHMIRSSFRIAIQDLSATSRVSKAVVEYWEQLGIHPQVAEIRARNYLAIIQNKINNAEQVTITDMYEFLDAMVKEFGQEYKKALERIGLTELGSEEFMAKGVTKPQ